MRVVRSAAEFSERLDEARREAGAAFGNDAVFLERYMRARAAHRSADPGRPRTATCCICTSAIARCSGGIRRWWKWRPRWALDPGIRRALAEAAVQLARAAGYYNAGTVEFLVDADSGEWYFIEVNPRIQVEHTVTEMVTGIDLVRCQIQVAAGTGSARAEMGLPAQDRMPLYGFALQCRITTEDPANNFVPDYGKHSHLPLARRVRHPAGRRHRHTRRGDHAVLRFAAGEDDRLGPRVPACLPAHGPRAARIPRARREDQYSVSGKRGEPPGFPGRPRDHRDGWSRPRSCSQFAPRRDRATKLLTYLAEVIVNGNPTVAGKAAPAEDRTRRQCRRTITAAPPDGTRQLLQRLGPERFAEWTRSQKRLLLTDTTFRDAHQSLLATRVRTYDMLAIAELRGAPAAQLVQPGNVGRRDVRRGHALPARRSLGCGCASCARRFPISAFRCCCAASNAVGYTAYPDNVVEAFIYEAAAQGIDIFRIFDSLNWLPNMKVSMEAVRKTGTVCEAAICYTGDILDPRRDKYSLDYYVHMAKELERMGAHMLAIKDMAGLCKPVCRRKAGEDAAAGDRHSDPLPHPRYQRHQRGQRAEGGRSGRGHRRRRAWLP